MPRTAARPEPSDVENFPADTGAVETGGAMTHREVLEAMSGLLLAMFVAMLSSTVVSNALPRDRQRPARQPDRLHLGRRRDPARR